MSFRSPINFKLITDSFSPLDKSSTYKGQNSLWQNVNFLNKVCVLFVPRKGKFCKPIFSYLCSNLRVSLYRSCFRVCMILCQLLVCWGQLSLVCSSARDSSTGARPWGAVRPRDSTIQRSEVHCIYHRTGVARRFLGVSDSDKWQASPGGGLNIENKLAESRSWCRIGFKKPGSGADQNRATWPRKSESRSRLRLCK